MNIVLSVYVPNTIEDQYPRSYFFLISYSRNFLSSEHRKQEFWEILLQPIFTLLLLLLLELGSMEQDVVFVNSELDLNSPRFQKRKEISVYFFLSHVYLLSISQDFSHHRRILQTLSIQEATFSSSLTREVP